MVVGIFCSWKDWIKIWSIIIGVFVLYKQVLQEEMIEVIGEYDFGFEVVFMYIYVSDLGYDGGMDFLIVDDICKVSCGLFYEK